MKGPEQWANGVLKATALQVMGLPGNGSRAKSTHSQQSKRGGQKQQGGPEPDDLTHTITLY